MATEHYMNVTTFVNTACSLLYCNIAMVKDLISSLKCTVVCHFISDMEVSNGGVCVLFVAFLHLQTNETGRITLC